MSPADIRTLLNIYAIPEPIDKPVDWLLKHALVEEDLGDNRYACTFRGQAMVKMLCDTPLPEPGLIDPRTNKVIKL